MTMLKRWFIVFGLLLVVAVGNGQLIAWQISIHTNEPQDNDEIAESMVRVPGGDVIIESCSGTFRLDLQISPSMFPW
jgi:hypothetical protein